MYAESNFVLIVSLYFSETRSKSKSTINQSSWLVLEEYWWSTILFVRGKKLQSVRQCLLDVKLDLKIALLFCWPRAVTMIVSIETKSKLPISISLFFPIWLKEAARSADEDALDTGYLDKCSLLRTAVQRYATRNPGSPCLDGNDQSHENPENDVFMN